MSSLSAKIDNVSCTVQWPAMWNPLNKVIEWRNKDNPNFVKKVTASIACVSIALTTVASSITKLAFGIIFLIPPFFSLGATLLASILFFESQVFTASLTTAITSLFHQKVNNFRLELR